MVEIRNDREYSKVMKRIDELVLLDDQRPLTEQEHTELLRQSLRIEVYCEKHYPLDKTSKLRIINIYWDGYREGVITFKEFIKALKQLIIENL